MPSLNNDKIRVCMTVACANDVSGASHRDDSRQSPVLHTAIHNLLDGLKKRDDVAIDVVYGRMAQKPGEERQEGSLHYLPIPYKPLPVPGMGGPYIARTLALLKYIKHSKPDVVHGQGTERESGLVAALSGRPSVLTLHGNFREIAKTLRTPPWDYHSINARLESFAGRRVDGIICISSYTRKLVQELTRNLWILPNAVNSKFLSIQNRPKIGKIVCIAGIGSRKNQVNFLKAFSKQLSVASDLNLEFWGPINNAHPYAQEFLQLIDDLPFARYMGSASPDEIPEVLQDADVLVLPSIEDNCPVCILEAMAAGVPVVASDVGGIPDLVAHGKTGYLSDPEEQTTIWENLAAIIQDRDLRSRFSNEAKSIALKQFTSESIASEHVSIYRQLLACQ